MTVPSPSARAGAILLVEDDPTFAAYMRDRLSRAAYAVDWAADGLSALIQLQRARPDLLVMDLALPAVDGLSLLRRLRAVPGIADLPVIVMTGRYSASDVEQAMALGVADYMIKPFDEAVFMARVASCIDPPDSPDSVVFLRH